MKENVTSLILIKIFYCHLFKPITSFGPRGREKEISDFSPNPALWKLSQRVLKHQFCVIISRQLLG